MIFKAEFNNDYVFKAINLEKIGSMQQWQQAAKKFLVS